MKSERPMRARRIYPSASESDHVPETRCHCLAQVQPDRYGLNELIFTHKGSTFSSSITFLFTTFLEFEMGLLKRLFSLGSKKNKKQRPPIVHNTPILEQPWLEVRTVDDEEHEAAVSRLLRSSSARFVETAELNYTTLPPLRKQLLSIFFFCRRAKPMLQHIP